MKELLIHLWKSSRAFQIAVVVSGLAIGFGFLGRSAPPTPPPEPVVTLPVVGTVPVPGGAAANDVTNKSIGTAGKAVDVADKGLGVAEKGVNVTDKGVGVVDKGVGLVGKGVDIADKVVDGIFGSPTPKQDPKSNAPDPKKP